MAQPLDLDDLDGDAFLNNVGEAYTRIASHEYVVPDGLVPVGTVALNIKYLPAIANEGVPGARLAFSALESTSILNHNWYHLRHVVGLTAIMVPDRQLLDIVILRLLALREGLVSHVNDLDTLYITFGEVTRKQTANMPADVLDTAQAEIALAITAAGLDCPGYMASMRVMFTNVVCLMAYVFRTRGHHYMDAYSEIYNRLWDKIITPSTTGLLKAQWQHITTVGLHAIAPIVLDTYWRVSSRLSRCAATLATRLNAPAAGTAAVYSLRAGLEDSEEIILETRFFELQEFRRLKQRIQTIIRECSVSRWRNSVNARLYGENVERLDLQDHQKLAAMVLGIYQGISKSSTLLQSQSLVREAHNKPITEGIAQVLARALKQRFVDSVRRGGNQRMAIAPPRPQAYAPGWNESDPGAEEDELEDAQQLAHAHVQPNVNIAGVGAQGHIPIAPPAPPNQAHQPANRSNT